MVTPYGKFLRKLRIDRSERLEDMAENLGVSKSYLSLIENGAREVRSQFSSKIADIYHLTSDQCKDLILAASETPQKTITIDLEPIKNNRSAQLTAEYFANLLPKLTEKQTDQIRHCMDQICQEAGIDRVIGDFS